MILTLVFLVLAVLCFAIKELHAHGKLKWTDLPAISFWGVASDERKYKWDKKTGEQFPPPSNWYYRFFKIKYKERWPTSATLTVAFTDGEHLAQAGFKLFIALSFAPLTGWIWAGVIWLTFGLSFTIFYKLLSR